MEDVEGALVCQPLCAVVTSDGALMPVASWCAYSSDQPTAGPV